MRHVGHGRREGEGKRHEGRGGERGRREGEGEFEGVGEKGEKKGFGRSEECEKIPNQGKKQE